MPWDPKGGEGQFRGYPLICATEPNHESNITFNFTPVLGWLRHLGQLQMDFVALFQTCAEFNQDVKSGCGLNRSMYNIFFLSSLFRARGS